MTEELLVPGSRLGSFTLARRLALGGMAEIWLAHENGAERAVALKVLLSPYARDPTFRSMFLDEVRIACRLTHENIVEVHGAHEIDGHLIQAMELIDGRDLRRVLSSLARAGEMFPVPLALYVAREVARALSYAHTKRSEDGRPLEIVHRDISPHNVMVTRQGSVKLLDFGIARAAERLTRTRTGVIKGKVSYMAPEQALAIGVTPRTDIYATGIVLWEMLAMRRLFKAESDALILDLVVKSEVPLIRTLNPSVPEEVETLLAEMLAQRAAMRPDSMRTVENALTRILTRRFRDGEASADAMARWVSPWLEEDTKKTGKFHPPPGRDGSDASPQTGGADPTVLVMVTACAPIVEEATSAQQGDSTLRDAEPVAFANASPSQKDTDPVRLPTRSEIIRAVDAVTTLPLAIGGLERPAGDVVDGSEPSGGDAVRATIETSPDEPGLDRRSEPTALGDLLPSDPEAGDRKSGHPSPTLAVNPPVASTSRLEALPEGSNMLRETPSRDDLSDEDAFEPMRIPVTASRAADSVPAPSDSATGTPAERASMEEVSGAALARRSRAVPVIAGLAFIGAIAIAWMKGC